jgi:polysaccharide export outer membrane protein
MKVRVLLLFVLALSLFQISFGQLTSVQSTTEVKKVDGYMLGPGDVVEGKVLGEEQFNFVSTVDEDGKIQVPFFDDGIAAKCRTEKQLRTDVAQLLSKYLKNPQISVRVTDRKSRPPVTVSGEVRTPGQVDLRRTARLLELISFSQGVTDDTNGMIQVFRTTPPMCSDTTEETNWKEASTNGLDVPSRMYSLTSLQQGRDEANPIILPGDVIVVMKASPVYITGEVRIPGGVYLKEGGLSLTQAVAMVGGVNREAKVKDIKIYRLKPNSKDRDVISANIDLIKKGEQKDLMLEPYDIVEVNKSKKKVWEIALELATGLGKTAANSVTGGIGTRILY